MEGCYPKWVFSSLPPPADSATAQCGPTSRPPDDKHQSVPTRCVCKDPAPSEGLDPGAAAQSSSVHSPHTANWREWWSPSSNQHGAASGPGSSLHNHPRPEPQRWGYQSAGRAGPLLHLEHTSSVTLGEADALLSRTITDPQHTLGTWRA